MITKRTVLNQTEIIEQGFAKGTIQVRFAIEIVEDGQVISKQWHRTVLPPGADVDLQLGFVNDHLKQLNNEPVTNEDHEVLRNRCAVIHTPEVVSAYLAKLQK